MNYIIKKNISVVLSLILTLITSFALPLAVPAENYGELMAVAYWAMILGNTTLLGMNSALFRIDSTAIADFNNALNAYKVFTFLQAIICAIFFCILVSRNYFGFQYLFYFLVLLVSVRLVELWDYLGDIVWAEVLRNSLKLPLISLILYFVVSQQELTSKELSSALNYVCIPFVLIFWWLAPKPFLKIYDFTPSLFKMIKFGYPLSLTFIVSSSAAIIIRDQLIVQLTIEFFGYFALMQQIFIFPAIIAGFFIVNIEKRSYEINRKNGLRAVRVFLTRLSVLYASLYLLYACFIWAFHEVLYSVYFYNINTTNFEKSMIYLCLFGLCHFMSLSINIYVKVISKPKILLLSGVLSLVLVTVYLRSASSDMGLHDFVLVLFLGFIGRNLFTFFVLFIRRSRVE